MMNSPTSVQDRIPCDLCPSANVKMYCDTCLFKLCKDCVDTHKNAECKVVKFQPRTSTPLYPGCTSHDRERCEMYCNPCHIPICNTCLASDQHLGHKFLKIIQVLEEKKEKITKEKYELYEEIYPAYQGIVSDVQNKMSQLERKYGDLLKAITKYGEVWQKEIDKLVQKLKSEVEEMKTTQLRSLQKSLDEMNKTISDINDEINSIDVALDSNDVSKVLSVMSNVEKYKNLPQITVPSAPIFIPGVQVEKLCILFGTLSSISVITLQTGFKCLYSVACLNDKEVWISGDKKTMELFNIDQGSLPKSITTKSGNIPEDIAVTNSGNLVYTDLNDRTVNIVKNEEIETVITLQNWKPRGICSTYSNDLLVIMSHDDDQPQTKVVRYSGSTEKQTIQFDDQGQPLYSFGFNINENRNLDVCVVDWEDRAVVVVNEAGKLRFRYTGHTPTPENHLTTFYPLGITTDSQSHILAADNINHCVHIIDQDGQFIRYIHCGLENPWGLCIDRNDNVFVAESNKKQVKKIRNHW